MRQVAYGAKHGSKCRAIKAVDPPGIVKKDRRALIASKTRKKEKNRRGIPSDRRPTHVRAIQRTGLDWAKVQPKFGTRNLACRSSTKEGRVPKSCRV